MITATRVRGPARIGQGRCEELRTASIEANSCQPAACGATLRACSPSSAAGIDAVQPLPTMQRRRAAMVSVAAHGAFLALLTFIGDRTELPSFEPPLIVG